MKSGERLPGRATPGAGQLQFRPEPAARLARADPPRPLRIARRRVRLGFPPKRPTPRHPAVPTPPRLSRTPQQHPVVEHRVDCRSGSRDPSTTPGRPSKDSSGSVTAWSVSAGRPADSRTDYGAKGSLIAPIRQRGNRVRSPVQPVARRTPVRADARVRRCRKRQG